MPRLPLNNASEDFQRRILDNLVTAVILLDRDLALRYLNPAAEETFGVSGRQAFGQSLDRLLVNKHGSIYSSVRVTFNSTQIFQLLYTFIGIRVT